MFRQLKYFLILVYTLSFKLANCQNQAGIIIKGTVLSKENNTPVQGASVIFRDSKDSIVEAYTITNENGKFIIKKAGVLLHKYAIVVSHISYVTETFNFSNITLPVNENVDSLVLRISMRVNKLENIIIKASKSPVILKNDTIEYSAKPFITPEVKKLEDLLKNINGFSIDESGLISYNGKQLEKILIDGEDLADKSYKIISKNLDVALIDKVQVVKNYNDDRLLRNIQSSDKVGINIKINNNYKNRLSMSTDLGFSLNGKQDVGINSIYLQKKVKFLTIVNYNNTGNISSKNDLQYFYHEGENNTSEINAYETFKGLIQPSLINTPKLEEPYKNDNNSFNNAVISSFKIGSKIKMKYLFGLISDVKRMEGEDITETEITSVDKWVIGTQQKARFSEKSIINRIGMQYDNSKNTLGFYNLSFSGIKQTNYFGNISRGKIIDTLNEHLQNNFHTLNFTGSETIKTNLNAILKIEFNYTNVKGEQNFLLNTNRLTGYYTVDSSYTTNKEILFQDHQQSLLNIRYIGKLLNYSYTFGIRLSDEMYNFSNNQTLSSSKQSFSDSNYLTNFTNPRISKLKILGILSGKLTNKTIFSLGGSVGKSFSEAIFNERKSLPDYKLFIEVRRNFSEFKNFHFQYTYKVEIPELSFFHPDFLISGDVTILKPSTVIDASQVHEIKLSYFGLNIYRNSQIFSTLIYHSGEYEYLTANTFNPEYSILQYLPSKKNIQVIGLVNAEKYIPTLKTKVSIQFQGTSLKRYLLINQTPKENLFNLLSTQIKFISSFSFPINFEISSKIQYLENEYLNVKGSKNKFWQNENSFKMKVLFTKKMYASIFYNYYLLTKSNSFNTLDLYTSYKLNNKLTFSIKVHNFLNAEALSQKTASASILSISSYNVVPFYFLGKISFLL